MSAQIYVAPIERGICVQIVGKGSMHESAVVRDMVVQVLNSSPDARAVMDLTRCHYLDSTLLGCLITIHRVAGVRWKIVAPPDVVKSVLAPTRLDTLLPITDQLPQLLGEPVLLDITPSRLSDMTQHLYDCHARLAEIEGPLQPVFAKIARQMKSDLSQTSVRSS